MKYKLFFMCLFSVLFVLLLFPKTIGYAQDSVITPINREDMVNKVDAFIAANLQAQSTTFVLKMNGDFIRQYSAVCENDSLTSDPAEPYFNTFAPIEKFKNAAGNDFYSTIFSTNGDSVSINFTGISDLADNFFTEISISYHVNWSQSYEQTQALKAYARGINASILTSSMSQYQKVKAIHDYLIHNYDYDMSFSNSPPYALISSRKYNCQSITAFCYLLLKDAGLDAKIVLKDVNGKISTAEGKPNEWSSHAWNMVNVDGKWYHLDVTWDECVPKEAYRYFLKSTAEFKTDHRWDASIYPTASVSYNGPVTNTQNTTTKSPQAQTSKSATSNDASSEVSQSSASIVSSSSVISEATSASAVSASKSATKKDQDESDNKTAGRTIVIGVVSVLGVGTIGGVFYFLKLR